MDTKTITKMIELARTMTRCEQAPGLSVLRHGQLVRRRYEDLVGHLRDGKPLAMDWKLPDWCADPLAVEGLPDDGTMAWYQVFHDCGKPAVLTYDEEGKRHFPGHADASRDAWLRAGGSQEVADLIAMDMDAHLLKHEGVPEFAARAQARALLLTALAEIHANAEMFGGRESISFKSKWKNLDRRGKAVLAEIRRIQQGKENA